MRVNTSTARLVAAKAAELIELASIFQSSYGKNYRMKPGSPDIVWALHEAIFKAQVDLACLLDLEALENPARRLPPWWKWQESIDTGMATQIMTETCHLIACCASFEASPCGATSPAIGCSQRVIAGMLHPSTLMMAQEAQTAIPKAS